MDGAVIPLDAVFAPWVLGAALVALLGLLVWRGSSRDRREYRLFKLYRDTERRQQMYRRWLLQSFGWFGGSAIVVLVLVWPFIPRMLAQVNAWPPMQSLRDSLSDGGVAPGLLVGSLIGLLVALLAPIFIGRNASEVPAIGDVQALLPRNRAELKYGWGLSINAGVVEELLFRLALPTLIFAVFGSALVAIIASLMVFGLLHAYQGVWGVAGTFVLGTVFMALFLATGNILWPIFAHAVLDLRSLVLIPVVVYKVQRKLSS